MNYPQQQMPMQNPASQPQQQMPMQQQQAPVQQSQQIPPAMVFDQEETVVTAGGKGLEIDPGTYPVVMWGIVSYQDYGFGKDADKLQGRKLIVVQFPTQLDDKTQKPKIGWCYTGESMGAKSNLYKMMQGIFGMPIGDTHPIRLPNKNIDPKKFAGVNALAAVGNTSKDQNNEKIGIISFQKYMDGMQQFQIDPTVEIPEFVTDRKEGKHLLNKQTAPEVPVMPQNMATQIPVQQQQMAPPPGQMPIQMTPPGQQVPVQQQQQMPMENPAPQQVPMQQQQQTPNPQSIQAQTMSMFNQATNPNNVTQ